MRIFFFLFILLSLSRCTTPEHTQKEAAKLSIEPETLVLTDTSRNREIPIAIYNVHTKTRGLPVVVFSHGYGQNKGGDYLAYSYLTKHLAEQGYFVISIQHELPTDSLLPLTGEAQRVRRPFWDRGADNILFVINTCKKQQPELNFNDVTLIGHSNGGDMCALFPQKYPGVVNRIITLDNRRMPLPRTSKPKICTLRSSDQPADDGVLPDEAEIEKWGISIVRLNEITHNEMDDSANEHQRQEIRKNVMQFLSR